MSLFRSASYKQKGSSILVQSFINSMEPPGSAEISQIATNLCGSFGDPESNFFFVKYKIDFMKNSVF